MAKMATTLHPINLAVSFLLLAAAVAADCTCDPEDIQKHPKTATLPYKVGALFAILAASAVGVAVPLVGRSVTALSPDSDVFFMIKAFAAGIILATGFIHILPDAFEALSSPCLKGAAWENFPFAGLAAMMAAIVTLMVESTAAGYYRRVHFGGEEPAVATDEETAGEHAGHLHAHTHATHAHAHGNAAASKEATGKLELKDQSLPLFGIWRR